MKTAPINHKFYLAKVKADYCPSGYAIVQYVDGAHFDERTEQSCDESIIEIVSILF